MQLLSRNARHHLVEILNTRLVRMSREPGTNESVNVTTHGVGHTHNVSARQVLGWSQGTHASGFSATSATAAMTSGSSSACQRSSVGTGQHTRHMHHTHTAQHSTVTARVPLATRHCPGWSASCPVLAAARPAARLGAPLGCQPAAVAPESWAALGQLLHALIRTQVACGADSRRVP